MYGCEYIKKDGKRYRKAPTSPLESLSMFINGSSPDDEPNVELIATVTGKVDVWLTRTLEKDEQPKMDYGGPYWQLFWTHLTHEDQDKIRHKYPDIKYPPRWPPLPTATLWNSSQGRQNEWEYAIASRNIYDALSSSEDEEDMETLKNDHIPDQLTDTTQEPTAQIVSANKRTLQTMLWPREDSPSHTPAELRGWEQDIESLPYVDSMLVGLIRICERIFQRTSGKVFPKSTPRVMRSQIFSRIKAQFTLQDIKAGAADEYLQQAAHSIPCSSKTHLKPRNKT